MEKGINLFINPKLENGVVKHTFNFQVFPTKTFTDENEVERTTFDMANPVAKDTSKEITEEQLNAIKQILGING